MKLYMESFLEEIKECCDEVSISWSVMYNLDPNLLTSLKKRLNKCVMEKKNEILHFYDFASTKGKYMMLPPTKKLFDIMNDYESYHDDLITFIKAMLKSDTKYSDINEAIKHINEAISVDKNFREKLFSESFEMTFSEAIENLDVLIALSTFLDKVYDTFIYLRGKDELASPRVKSLIDLYAVSAVEFIKSMISEICKFICDISDCVNGKKNITEEPKPQQYQLI